MTIVEKLVSPLGPVSRVVDEPPPYGLPRLRTCTAWLGSGAPDVPLRGRPLGARGQSLGDPDRARLLAVAEAMERYSARTQPRALVDAPATQLSGAYLPLEDVPACSDAELANPACPIRSADPRAAIRWVQGYDLVQLEPCWVPAVMVFNALPQLRDGERFTLPISTGHAVHSDPDEAALRAVLELVERDAAAVTWLQAMPLPRLMPPGTAVAEELLAWYDNIFVDTLLFDGTTDVGVPTVYALQLSEHDPWYHQLVGAATGRDLTEAAEKVLLELAPFRDHPGTAEYVPEHPGQIRGPLDGARFLGQRQRRHAFNFLLRGTDSAARPQSASELPGVAASALAAIGSRLAAVCERVVVVDQTTRELDAVGLSAAAAVAPALQPLSFHPAAQFRAHPRLYELPARMGHAVHAEADLNPWPQPFP